MDSMDPPPGGSTPQFIATATPPAKGMAIASLVLGICSMLMWLCPIIGLPVSLVGLILGVVGRQRQQGTMATVGLILSILGLVATLINAAIGAYLGATGQHPLLNSLQGS